MKKMRKCWLVIICSLALTTLAFTTTNPGPHPSHLNCEEVLIVWPEAPGLEGSYGSLRINRPDGSTVDVSIGPGYYNGPTAKWKADSSTYYNGPGTYTIVSGQVHGTNITKLPFSSNLECQPTPIPTNTNTLPPPTDTPTPTHTYEAFPTKPGSKTPTSTLGPTPTNSPTPKVTETEHPKRTKTKTPKGPETGGDSSSLFPVLAITGGFLMLGFLLLIFKKAPKGRSF